MSAFSISTQIMIDAASKKGWKYEIINKEHNLVVIYPGNSEPIFIHKALNELNSGLGYMIATDKYLCSIMAKWGNVQHPETELYVNNDQAIEVLKKYKRLVVKPLDTDQGVGITVGVTTSEGLIKAVNKALEKSKGVILQKFYEGTDHRFLVVGDEVVAVIKRRPAYVIGDGVKTVEQLIIEKNSDPRRGDDHDLPMSKIPMQDVIDHIGISRLNYVLPEKEELEVLGTSNFSQGGETEDLTDVANERLKDLAIKSARICQLGVAGVDIMTSDITKSPEETSAVMIEVNKIPGLRIHAYPTIGKSRDVGTAILDQIIKNREQKSK